MGGQMGQIGMQFLPELLYKFPDGIPNVSHQGITGILHVNPKLYPPQANARGDRSSNVHRHQPVKYVILRDAVPKDLYQTAPQCVESRRLARSNPPTL